MFNMIERGINNLNKDKIDNFARSKNINLSTDELNFTYSFIKKNWKTIIGNPSMFNIDRLRSNYSQDNFIKLKKVYNEYLQNYGSFLK